MKVNVCCYNPDYHGSAAEESDGVFNALQRT